MSEVLVLGVPDEAGAIVLGRPDRDVPVGRPALLKRVLHRPRPVLRGTMIQPAPHVPDVSPDLPSRRWRAALALLRRMPQAAMSRSLGRLADVRLPRPMRVPVLGTFARAVGIDTSEAELSLTEYDSLNAFFVRRLRPGLRSLATTTS
jgi:hypothetical protein